MINPEIRRLHMLKRAHAKSKVKIIKKKVNAGKTSFDVQYEVYVSEIIQEFIEIQLIPNN